MKISEFRNGDAIDLLCDIIEPTARILADKEIVKAINGTGNTKKAELAKKAIKRHKDDVIEILAALDGVPVSEYSCNIFTITMKLLEILNDKELTDFFISQQTLMEKNVSTDAMENTKATEEE